MLKQGLLSLFTNLTLLFFLISSPVLSPRTSDRIGLSGLLGAHVGLLEGSIGGKLVHQIVERIFPCPGERNPAENSGSRDGIPQDYVKVVCERYPVYGATLGEINSGIYDIETGKGPYNGKEGKRYAAYATSDYQVNFHPVLLGYRAEDGEVAVDLGARDTIEQTIYIHLPDFRTEDPRLEEILEAEETRLLEHEMQHVEVYRSTGEKLRDAVGGARVTGYGAGFWDAYEAALEKLGDKVERLLAEAVESADEMNALIDMFTHHGVSQLIFPGEDDEGSSSDETLEPGPDSIEGRPVVAARSSSE